MTAIQFEDPLHPETVLPEQFQRMWGGTRTVTPERALLVAVLWQAADDLRAHGNVRRAHSRVLYRHAYRWVTSDDRSWPYSFLNVCDVLGLSAGSLRAELLRAGTLAAA
jgi:hypothetical protein